MVASRHRVLFAEDFDAPDNVPSHGAGMAPEAMAGVTDLDTAEPPPPPPAPSFPAEAVEQAREEGFADGYSRGLSQAAQDRAEIARQLLAGIAAQLTGADAAARQVAESSASAAAGLLMASLGSLFPSLCARHGGGEVAALARAVLPALDSEPRITIRLSPHVTADLEAELDRLDPDLRTRIVLVPTDAVPPGDVRIAWQSGGASRDAASLWARVVDTLGQYGIALPAASLAPAE